MEKKLVDWVRKYFIFLDLWNVSYYGFESELRISIFFRLKLGFYFGILGNNYFNI